MKNAFAVPLISYHSFLQSTGIRYQEDAKTLTVGKMVPGWDYVVFISCKTVGTENLLEAILPILKKYGSPFRLIKSQLLQYRLNAGAFGEQEVGKVISIFPRSKEEAVTMVTSIDAVAQHMKGPEVPYAQRVGNLIYVQKVKRVNDKIELEMPVNKSFPFLVPRHYIIKKRTRLFGWWYLNIHTIRSTPKGGVYKAINLDRFSFSWCLVKEGNPNALDDHFNRDMTDRLYWQKEVIGKLASHITTARVIDYFQRGDYSYLVLEYAEGTLLGQAVSNTVSRQPWRSLDTGSRIALLNLFLQAAQITSEIHLQGFIHRDITEGNFIILADGRLCILDFELAFNVHTQQPDPPFLLGTIGYASPEQLQYCWPDFSDDVYSLGALLIFAVTGKHPKDFIENDHRLTKKKLSGLTNNKCLTELAMRCLDKQPDRRPAVAMIIHTIKTVINETSPAYEKKTMAIGNY
jgi:hypothetical protein